MTDYGRMRAWESMSYAAGCLSFGVILQAAGIHWAMPIFGVASLGVVAWSVTLERDRPQRVERHGRLGTVGAVFREAEALGLLVAILLVWTGFNAAWNFIALKIADEGGGPMLVGFGLALGGLVEVPTMRFSSASRRAGDCDAYSCSDASSTRRVSCCGAPFRTRRSSRCSPCSRGSRSPSCSRHGVVVVGRLLPSTLTRRATLSPRWSASGSGRSSAPVSEGSSTREAGPVTGVHGRIDPRRRRGDRRVDRAVHPRPLASIHRGPRGRGPARSRARPGSLGSLSLPRRLLCAGSPGRSGSHRMGSSLRRGGCVVRASILIQTEVGRASQVTRGKLNGISGVVAVDPVTGPYDVIARGEASDLDELAKAIVVPIQAVEGVTRTLTCPVLSF